ncbi:MAG: hypothetical protein AB1333_02355 [Patescibacteria group bacterium]
MAKKIPVNLEDLKNRGVSELDFSKSNPNAFLIIPDTEEIKNESPLVRAIISELGGVEVVFFSNVGVKEVLRVKN